MVNSDAIPLPREGFRAETMDGETVLYRDTVKKMIYLNESASLVFGMCDGKVSVREIIELLAQAYPEAAQSIARDVFEVIDYLVEEGALRLEGEKSA